MNTLPNAKLTPRQSEILGLIRQYIQSTGYPPTRADIARELGFKSPNAAEEHLKALARKGAIEMIPGTSRGIRLPEDAGLPIVGRVAAGQPLLAVEHIEDRLDVAAELFRPRADYLLRVEGESMRDVGILDGDLLAVHQAEDAQNGEIVVARVDDEVTVKRFQRGRKRHEILLIAENPAYEPIEVDLRTQNFAIEGLSVGVIRQSI
ncbi:MAG: transcriptional repressor LexA [Pseudomonadota bacterium]